MKASLIEQAPLGRAVGRAFTRDHAMFTYDQNRVPVMDIGGRFPVHPGNPLAFGGPGSRPGVNTWDGKFVDSTGAFFVGELERLDPTMHEPLVEVSWGRDIDLREDVTLADDISSFTLTTYGAASGMGGQAAIGTGKSWIGRNADQIGGIGIDLAKVPHALTPWGMELKYTIFELESAAKAGRPIDQQKFDGLQLKYQMDVDEQVYFGDTSLNVTGLVNNSLVTQVTNAANGAAGSPLWTTKTPDEILTDFNTALSAVWTNSAFAVIPSRILLPTAAFGYISTQKVSLAGNMSILKYIQENNLLTTTGKGKLDIFPCKWCNGAGAGGTIGTGSAGHDRMVIYTKDKKRVRFPMVPLQRTPIQYDSIYHKTTYFNKLGVVEVVYPETIGYVDGTF